MTTTRAEPKQLALNWIRGDGAEACVSGEQLEAKLREMLVNDIAPVTPLMVDGLVQRDRVEGGFRADLQVLDANRHPLGTRELRSRERDCPLLTPSIVLVLSILVEIGARASRSTRACVQPCAAQEPVKAPALLPPPTDAATARSRWQFEPRAALAVGWGLNPEPAMGPALELHVRTPWWLTTLLRAGYWPGIRSAVARRGGPASVDFQALDVELAVCLPVLEAARWWFAACWGPALIVRSARMFGLSVTHDTLRPTLGAATSLRLAYAASRHWFLAFDASLLGLSRRDRYLYEEVDGTVRQVYRGSRFAAVLALGLGFRP